MNLHQLTRKFTMPIVRLSDARQRVCGHPRPVAMRYRISTAQTAVYAAEMAPLSAEGH